MHTKGAKEAFWRKGTDNSKKYYHTIFTSFNLSFDLA